ncbi:MAG TPA: TrpR, YerC/YecD [Firmicutes bacterium]|nr:TrpR, YerC/YecD [Bacillota bacterium]
MSYDPRMRDEHTDRLFQAILLLRDLDECYRFFYDLCTIGEVKALAQRFQVAKLLDEGHTYDRIERETGMSSATISRIKRFLQYGADGYRLALDRLSSEDRAAPENPAAREDQAAREDRAARDDPAASEHNSPAG